MDNTPSKHAPTICKKIGRLGLILFNRSEKKNALTATMYQLLAETIAEWELDPHIYGVIVQSNDQEFFSSGGDLSAVYSANLASVEQAQDIFKTEYEAIWAVECYTKPFILLVNGAAMGAAAALTQFCTHLVAGENFSWSMPEVRAGFFPDAGMRHILARMPHSIGLYLGLTGRSINRADAAFLGLVDLTIDSSHFQSIIENCIEANPIDPVLDNLTKQPTTGDLQTRAALIERTFGKNSVEEIIHSLQVETGAEEQWANELASELLALPPLSLKVTFEAIRRAADLLPEQNLVADYELTHHFLNGPDFINGIKAKFIEKTSPTWQPSRLEDVSGKAVSEYFTKLSTRPLDLPPRELGFDK